MVDEILPLLHAMRENIRVDTATNIQQIALEIRVITILH